jgi:hypothetical protein
MLNRYYRAAIIIITCAGHKTAMGQEYCAGQLVRSSVESYNANHTTNPLRVVRIWKDGHFLRGMFSVTKN